MISPDETNRLRVSIRECGYAATEHSAFDVSALQGAFMTFRTAWQDLPFDRYLPDRSCYRFRRYGRFALDAAGELVRLPHAPFYQSRDINPYAGGISRDFAPMTEASFTSPFLEMLIRQDFAIFGLNDGVGGGGDWGIQVHQIRVETPTTDSVRPTPEGVHRDGHDFLAMHLMGLENADGGESIIVDASGDVVGTHLLARPLDTLLVDDRRVAHEVRPISRRSPENPARRDMLLIDFDPLSPEAGQKM